MTVRQILREWSRFFVHQDNNWQTLPLSILLCYARKCSLYITEVNCLVKNLEFRLSTNPSINQSVSQSINQSISQLVGHWSVSQVSNHSLTYHDTVRGRPLVMHVFEDYQTFNIGLYLQQDSKQFVLLSKDWNYYFQTWYRWFGCLMVLKAFLYSPWVHIYSWPWAEAIKCTPTKYEHPVNLSKYQSINLSISQSICVRDSIVCLRVIITKWPHPFGL